MPARGGIDSMNINQMIEVLEQIRAKHGGELEVGYVDNGPFAENGGWITPDDVTVCKDTEHGDLVVVL